MTKSATREAADKATFTQAEVTAGDTAARAGRKNLIINGGMQVSQRGTSFTGDHGGSGAYTIDRWKAWQTGGGDITIEQSTEVPEEFTGGRSIKGTVATADSSIGATDYYSVSHYIEGQNIVGTDFGGATAKTLTLSFYIKTSVTGTYGGVVRNSDGTKNYPFSYVVADTNWNRYTITFTGATDGTWLYTNALGLSVFWGLGVGATYTDTAGSWNTKASVISADSSLNWIATNGATFHLTGVQLELGSVATDFEHRSYGEELQLCKRYCQELCDGITARGILNGAYFTTTQFYGVITLPVEMRAAPTTTVSDHTLFYVYASLGGYPVTSFNQALSSSKTVELLMFTTARSQGDAAWMRTNSTAASILLESEL
jgi:hypothetical protein